MNNMSKTIEREIVENMDNPRKLEILYRRNKSTFHIGFNKIFDSISTRPEAQCWNERLNYIDSTKSLLSRQDLLFLAISIFISGWIVKFPDLMGWQKDEYISRNISFIFFEIILFYFAWKNQLGVKKIVFSSGIFIIACIFINLLPKDNNSQTMLLACIHLPIFLWSIVGLMFTGNDYNKPNKRIEFLKFNGDLLVMIVLLLLSGGLFGALTVNLFLLIGIHTEVIFTQYILNWGLPAIPILSTVLVRQYPQLVGKVSPLIAKLFSPLVFITLSIFLIAILATRKDPYNDREYLLVFNAMLICVMAIILFSLSEVSRGSENKWHVILLFALSLLAIIDAGIALSAISFRLSQFGISPNRIAVLGSNILILLHLIAVSYRIFRVLKFNEETASVEKTIAFFLPVYSAWAACIVFILPFIFQLK